MNHLLKELLCANPHARLDAKTALDMPVFDDFRGTMLPLREKKSSVYFYDGTIDTYLDEDMVQAQSIHSLESKSRMIAPGYQEGSQSVFSVHYEGQSPYIKSNHGKGNPSGSGQLFEHTSQMSDMLQSSNFQSSKASQQSWKEGISPLNSPLVPLRMLTKQLSGSDGQYKNGVLSKFLSAPQKIKLEVLQEERSPKNE